MPPTSADLAYERATSHIRSTVRNTLVNDFNTAGAWRDADLSAFLKRAVPITTGGQRATSQVTATYLRSLLGQSIPWNPNDLIGDGIRGIPPAEIYTRPYHDVWSRLADGTALPEAVNLGANRLSSLVNTDMQLAKIRTSEQMIANADGVYGYRRTVNGQHPCDRCLSASTQAYHNGNLMPIHSNCSCSVMPITDPLEMGSMTNAYTLGKSGPIASPSSELGQTFDQGDLFPNPHPMELPQFADDRAADYLEQETFSGLDDDGIMAARGSLSPHMADGVRGLESYTGPEYQEINTSLRTYGSDWWGQGLSDSTQLSVRRLTRYIDEASTTKQNMTVWRGMESTVSGAKGELLTDYGFLSTSASRSTATAFTGNNGTLWKILMPKGSHAVTGSIAEGEMVLQRGSSLRILHITDVDGQRLITAIVEQG